MPKSAARPDLLLGRYEIVATIGAGAFGRVLHAIDTHTGAARAIKIVAAAGHDALLLDEFEQLARLAHPSVPRVFEVGRTTAAIDGIAAGAPFFVAEWIDGTRADQLPPTADRARRVWSLCADLAGALAAIHAAGLVHGDVAPQNVLVAGDRAVLVDLGMARVAGARGTPAYMAPEAFAGELEPRSDLYGLGATIVRVITGRPLVEAATLGELAHRVVSGGAALEPGALRDVPAPLADLIGRLIARDPAQRPSSAIAVLDELDQLAPAIAPGSARRARPRIGAPPAPASWPGAAEVVAAIAAGLREGERGHGAAAIVVVGDAATGARELVDAAVRRWQLDRVAQRAAPAPVLAGTLDDVGARLGIAADGGDPRRWLERIARAARAASAAIVIELGDDPRRDELIAAFARAPGERAVIAIADAAPPSRAGVAIHVAPLVDDVGVAAIARAMAGGEPPHAWVHALRTTAGGRALAVIELLRSIAGEAEPFAIDWAARTTAGLAGLRERELRALSAGARELAAAVAVWGGRVRGERAFATARGTIGFAELGELERAGLARRRGDDVVLDATVARAAEAVAGAAAIMELAARALATPAIASVSPELVAEPLARAELDDARASRACEVAEQLLARGRADRARALAARAFARAPARAGLIGARAAAAVGAYREADALATAARDAGADPIATALVVARAAQRAGELDAAERALAALYAAHGDDAEVAGTYARLLVTRARFAEARAIATASPAPLVGLRAEAAGLAAFYLGDLDDADRLFAALEVGGAAAGDHAAAGRALSLRGMVAQQRGQLGVASDRYREAARKLGDAGEVHAGATAELNLGTVLAERGRASEALPRLAAAERVFADLGATTERVAAELNRGNALLAVAQRDAAREAAEAAVAHAAGAPHLRAFALLVAGDARRATGDGVGAERAYREALAIGRERGDAHAQISAWIALAEAGHADVDAAAADAACTSADDRDRWTLARGRLRLATTTPVDVAAVLVLARACAEVALRAGDADRLERAYRGHAVAAQLGARAGDGALARGEADRARAAHAAIVAAAAPGFRAALAADPELARLPGEAVHAAAASPTSTLAGAISPSAVAPLRRLLTLSRRLNSEASVDRILDDVIDTAIELTSAERGFLLLRQPSGELAVVVSRNFAAHDLANGSAPAQPSQAAPSVSRSIAERAAQTGEPVMTVDAGVDERFGAAASVAALRLRSVLAVPLRQRGTITGCIYVDHRLRGGAFDDGAAATLGELADIAAIAIENARLTDDLRRTTRAVDELNAQLSAELAERDAELVRVKAELPDRDRLRHRYERIVGRSPAMVRMLEVIDRAAATVLPIVVVGESGTGKELVARALHDNGPRKDAPFVAINCGAVPESLLESELFGHVRGAFTGAERDRRGLFEVADGGTLFLDEIAETSGGMQAKLLRVLQDGVIRRVGDTATRKVDVRVIAATQQPLAALVDAGRFREDLRFRLEVIAVDVPPLRDREGDLPLLVDRLVAARMPPGVAPPRFTRAAQRALAQHRWPGNVRELENAIARGVAMGGDVIDLGDLPEAIGAAAARPEPARPAVGDDLRLKPALQSTEQAYISAAMGRAKNNQTVAARMLGVSRFGLQKKLRRLAGEDPDADD